MHVFISRDLSPDSEFRRLLQAQGWQVRGASLVELSALPFHTLPQVHWVFFSSKNAVRFFFRQIEKAGLLLPELQWAALGEATSKALHSYVQNIGFTGSGEPVSAAAAFGELAGGQAVLFPGARHSQQSVQLLLAGAVQGIHLEVYDNRPVYVPAPRSESVLVFTSPMNAQAYFSRHSLQSGQRVVAIGATTAAALQALGMTSVITATAPTETALAEAVLMV